MWFLSSEGKIESKIVCIIQCDSNKEVRDLAKYVSDYPEPQASELSSDAEKSGCKCKKQDPKDFEIDMSMYKEANLS